MEYLGIRFDYPVENAAELGWVGGVTKTSKSGQKFDADGRGSDVVYRAGGAKGTDMLTHVRAVLSILKFRGHPDLQSTVVSKAQNYWLKITGASEMHTRGVKVFMTNGQGTSV